MRSFLVLALSGWACILPGVGVLGQPLRLSIDSRPSQQVHLSWTNASTQLFLQSAASLRSPILWQNVATSPVLQGNRFSLDIGTTDRAQYFRLAGASLTRISSTSPQDHEQGVSVN